MNSFQNFCRGRGGGARDHIFGLRLGGGEQRTTEKEQGEGLTGMVSLYHPCAKVSYVPQSSGKGKHNSIKQTTECSQRSSGRGGASRPAEEVVHQIYLYHCSCFTFHFAACHVWRTLPPNVRWWWSVSPPTMTIDGST